MIQWSRGPDSWLLTLLQDECRIHQWKLTKKNCWQCKKKTVLPSSIFKQNNFGCGITLVFLLQYRIFLNGFGYAFFGVPSRDLESTWKSDRIRTPVFPARDRPLLSNGPSTSCDVTPNYFQHVSWTLIHFYWEYFFQ